MDPFEAALGQEEEKTLSPPLARVRLTKGL